MPKIEGDPESLRPFLFHGVELDWRDGADEAIGECPWCNREEKFSVSILSGQWRCLSCNKGTETGKSILGGNHITFLRRLWELSYEKTRAEDYRRLAEDRKLLSFDTLLRWQLAKSLTTGDWLVPGFNEDGKLVQLYRYIRIVKEGKARMAWLLTPTLGHKILGMNNYDPNKSTIDLCEGLWDGAAWWEILSQTKETESGFVATANVEASLLSDRNVLSVPTCEVFFDNWSLIFAGKVVNLIGQNDHPRKNPKTGEVRAPASYEGMKRVATILSAAPNPPLSINYLRWNSELDHDATKPHGYDVRDHLNA